MVQLGFFFHMKLATGASSLRLTRPLIFAISFMLLFSVVIALFKDIQMSRGMLRCTAGPLYRSMSLEFLHNLFDSADKYIQCKPATCVD